MKNKKPRSCMCWVMFFLITFISISLVNDTLAGEKELISLDYKDASLSSVLRSLSYSYDLNLVVTKNVQGTVSVSLRNVSIEEALDAILKVNGYTFKKQGNLIYITPGPGVEGINQETKSVKLSYLNAHEAAKLLNKVVSSEGDIQVNEATNSLVITDYSHQIEKVNEVLKEIDVPPVQVIIEAKILDIQSSALRNFGTTIGTLRYDPPNRGIFDRDTLTDEEISGTSSLAGTSSSLSGGQITLATTLRDIDATITIDALVRKNKAHLLASPSIATLNGKEARIIIGEKFPYTEKTQTTTGTTETTRFVDVGTTLRVVPWVSPDGWITMNVHPEVSSVSQALDAGPRITTREADATIRVRNKQTIIIGGLINKQDDSVRGGVPYFRHIPVIGPMFFSNRSADRAETELTVFITPRIIDNDEALSHQKVAEQEVYLNVDRKNNMNMVEKLIEHADNLALLGTAESLNKSKEHRMAEMLNTYKLILSQYPDTIRTDQVLVRISKIYMDHFKDYNQAIDHLLILINDYPESRYRAKAKRLLKKAQRKQMKSAEQKDELSKSE